MKSLGAVFACLLATAVACAPALARTDYIMDNAGMFSAATVSQLDSQIANFNAQTGKEVVVVTVPTLNGATVRDAAQAQFSQQQVNGVLIFLAKTERRDIIIPDAAGANAGWFTSEVTSGIRQDMEQHFRDGDFDGGITAAVSGVLNVYRQHLNSAGGVQQRSTNNYAYANSRSNGGFHLSMFWWIIIAVVGFMILRSLMRSMGGGGYGYGPGGPAPGAPGYGYGPGYYGGGGGGFWSGLLGGLGGAWLGNEMFRGGGGGGGNVGDQGGSFGGNAGDSGGWSSDAGSAGMGGSSSGDWGGGGFGGGDFGGGGGGGDSGGGW